MVKRKKGRAVEQQMIPGDVDEGMREQPPPFAALNGAGLEDHRAPAGAGQDGDVEKGEQGDEEQQFRPATQREAGRSLAVVGTPRRGVRVVTNGRLGEPSLRWNGM